MMGRHLTWLLAGALAAAGCLARPVPPKSDGVPGGLDISIAAAGRTTGVAGQAVIVSVVDIRGFKDRPETPEVPTFHKGVGSMTAGERKRVIGRERDGSGKARGNVFLKEGMTVESVVGDTLRNTLIGLGYGVIDDPAKAAAGATRIYVIINKFWGWVRLEKGFLGSWPHVDAELATDLDIEGPGGRRRTTVSATATSKSGFGGVTEGNWLRAYRLLLEGYSTELAKVMAPMAP